LRRRFVLHVYMQQSEGFMFYGQCGSLNDGHAACSERSPPVRLLQYPDEITGVTRFSRGGCDNCACKTIPNQIITSVPPSTNSRPALTAVSTNDALIQSCEFFGKPQLCRRILIKVMIIMYKIFEFFTFQTVNPRAGMQQVRDQIKP
jgi:hypothetical protein